MAKAAGARRDPGTSAGANESISVTDQLVSNDSNGTLQSASSTASVTPTSSSTPSGNGSMGGLVAGPPSVSAVWSYFEKDNMGNSICKFCDKVIKGHHSSNLLSHLRTTGRTDPAHAQANSVCEEHRENKRHKKRQKVITFPTTTTAVPGTDIGGGDITLGGGAGTFTNLAAAAAAGVVPPTSLFGGGLGTKEVFYRPATPFASAAAAAAAAMAAYSFMSKEQREIFGLSPQAAVAQQLLTQEQFTQDVALLILMENLPLNFTSTSGVQLFLNKLLTPSGQNQLNTSFDKTKLTKSIHMLYESMQWTIKLLVSKAQNGVSVSMNQLEVDTSSTGTGNTGKQKVHFITLTVHFSVNFKQYNVLIGLKRVPHSSSSSLSNEEMENFIQNTLDSIGIKEKIIAILSPPLSTLPISIINTNLTNLFFDGQNQNQNQNQTTQIHGIVYHVKEALRRKNLVKWFPQVVERIDSFIQNLHKLSLKNQATLGNVFTLLTQVYTKYTPQQMDVSFYEVLSLFAQHSQVIKSIDNSFDSSNGGNFQTLVQTLGPIFRYVDALEGKTNVHFGSDQELFKQGLSSVSTIVTALVMYSEKQSTTSTNSNIKSLCGHLVETLRGEKLSPLTLAASLLDPRYKNQAHCYLDPVQDIEKAKKYLLQLFNNSTSSPTTTVTSSPIKTKTNSPVKRKATTSGGQQEAGDLLGHLSTNMPTSPTTSTSTSTTNSVWEKELQAFWKIPLVDRNIDPLNWWLKNQLRFPTLAPIAELVLSVPATFESIKYQDLQDDPEDGLVLEAYVSFQKNKPYCTEWFNTSTTTTTTTGSNFDHFQHQQQQQQHPQELYL